ncbi:MAG: hypothetical protein R3F46_03965 [bacterium]
MRNLQLCCLLALLLMAAASCSSGSSAGLSADEAAAAPVDELLLSRSGFSLELLGDHSILGLDPTALELKEATEPDGTLQLSVHSSQNAQLHGICLRIAYDPQLYTALGAERGTVLAALDGELLELSELSVPGRLTTACCRPVPDQAAGAIPAASGSELLRLDFLPMPAPQQRQ